jgi:peptide/nickel transport system permease protein
MYKFLLRRILQTIPVLLGISIAVFSLTRLTGDPAALILGVEATPEALERFRQENGLNDPIPVQYVRFLRGALRGDFGQSIRYREPALELFAERVPATLQLAGASMLLAIAFGIPMGVIAALNRNSWVDNLMRFLTLFGQAVPTFYIGLMLIILVAVRLTWLPTGGRGGGDLEHVILPAVTLATYLVALIARFTRSSMLEVLEQDYVRTARAKGLQEQRVIGVHVLKNAMLPVVTVIGLQVGGLLSGAVITETVFAWPGIGRLAIQAVFQRDFPVVQVTVMITALVFVMTNLFVDLIYGFLDPRIRFG